MANIKKILNEEIAKLDSQIGDLQRKREPLARALEALSGGASSAKGPPKAAEPVGKKSRKERTAAQRKAQSLKMKAYWAKKRKAAKKA